MSELNDLYQEVILDHNKRPRNFGRPADANREAEGFNPLCGDHMNLYMTVDGDVIRDVGFEGSGCAVSKASASMMTEALKGRTVKEAEDLFEEFRALVTGTQEVPSGASVGAALAGRTPSRAEGPRRVRVPLGKLAAFSGVSEFPMRVKCATLAWHTMKAALAGRAEAVSTE